MSYINSIEKAIIVFPFIALLFTIPFILHQYHKYGSIHKLRVFIIYSFILYLISIYFLVILPLPKLETVVWKPDMIRLVPFTFILDFIKETSFVICNPSTYLKALLEPCVYTVAFNLFMFVPLGMYLRYYFKCDFKHVLGYSFLLSFFFEITQLTGLYFMYPYPYRIFDVDDLLINTLGGLLGYSFMGIFSRFLPTRDRIDKEAFQIGKQVSGFRRITVFGLDFATYSIISLVVFLFGNTKLFLIIFVIYYGIIPLLSNGKTLGSQFLNVSFETPNMKFIRILLRHIILYFYYFGIPIGIIYGVVYFINKINPNSATSILICFLGLLFIFLFYIINFIWLIKRKNRFYDTLLQTTYQSTIVENKKNEIDNSLDNRYHKD